MTRRFFSTAMGLHMQDDPLGNTPAEDLENRSPEDDAQAAVEATTELNEAITASDEVDRYSDTADALEDAAAILDTIPEADQAHTALATTIASMATAGDPAASADDIAPAMESYLGRRVSTEGFKDAARKIWETIKRWVKKIWEKIEKFFYKHFGRIPRMRKSLAAAEKQLDAAESRPLEDKKIDLTSATSQMLIGGSEAKDFGSYVKALSVMESVVHDAFSVIGKSLAEGGEALQNAIGDFDVEKGAVGLKNIGQALTKCAPAKGALKSFSSGGAPVGYSTATGGVYEYTQPMPGNIVLRIGHPASYETTARAIVVDAQRNTGIQAVYPEKAKEASSSVNIATPNIDSIRKAIGSCKAMLDDMEMFYRGPGFKKIKESQGKIEKSGDKLSATISKIKPEDIKEGDLSYYRQATSTASTFVQKVLRTYGGLSSIALTSASFICHVASKTNSAHRAA